MSEDIPASTSIYHEGWLEAAHLAADNVSALVGEVTILNV